MKFKSIFQSIDPIIDQFVKDQGLKLFKMVKDDEIRRFLIGDQLVNISPPLDGPIRISLVHLDGFTKEEVARTSKEDLRITLEDIRSKILKGELKTIG